MTHGLRLLERLRQHAASLLHLAPFVGPDCETTDVYAHWEPSWVRHPLRQYRATDVDAEAGVEWARRLSEREEIEYAVVPAAERLAGGDAF